MLQVLSLFRLDFLLLLSRTKNTWLKWGIDHDFGLKYLFCSLRSQMVMVWLPVKKSLFWSPQERLEMSPGVLKNIQGSDSYCGRPFGSLVDLYTTIPSTSWRDRWLISIWCECDTNVTPGHIRGLQTHEVLTLYPGHWAGVSEDWLWRGMSPCLPHGCSLQVQVFCEGTSYE